MDALNRTLVDSQLNLVFRGASGIDDLGMPQGLIELEHFGTNRLAIAAGDALIGVDHRNFLSQVLALLLIVQEPRSFKICGGYEGRPTEFLRTLNFVLKWVGRW